MRTSMNYIFRVFLGNRRESSVFIREIWTVIINVRYYIPLAFDPLISLEGFRKTTGTVYLTIDFIKWGRTWHDCKQDARDLGIRCTFRQTVGRMHYE